jgi:ubiquinone/menaquinone biosynthesis C-methylase UbiE
MDEIVAHYEQVREEDRLAAGIGELERIRTRDMLLRFLEPPPARILDVGGGTGIHAAWLAERGYDVDLVDPVPRHVELARTTLAGARPGAGRAYLGDARSLQFDDDSADAVLMLGPLYHLTEDADRAGALAEARRVLRPNGVLFAAAISRFASLLDGFSRGLVRDPRFVTVLERDLEDGRHSNPTPDPAYFTTAYLHRPARFTEELGEAGFEVVDVIGVEGPFWCMSEFEALWAEPSTRSLMLRVLNHVGAEPALLGASAHILAVCRLPA